MLSLTKIRAALADHEPVLFPSPARVRDRACVAMVLAGSEASLSMCFIRRTERDDDPWSGQMAFPGGRADESDPTPAATAERETSEEVGLQLQAVGRLGALSEVPLRRIANNDSVLSPFVYYCGPQVPTLRPDPREIAAAFWIPVAHLWDPAHLTEVPWIHEGTAMRFAGIAHGPDVIWGLTHRVLTSFADLVGKPLPAGTRTPQVG